MAETIERLIDEAQLAVLTNKPLGPTRKILEGLDVMDKFRWVIGGDGPFPRKPDPAGLQHLMTQAQTSPERSVMVGDSGADLATARAAGTKVCLARYGFGYRVPPANLLGDEIVADSPAEILVSSAPHYSESAGTVGHAHSRSWRRRFVTTTFAGLVRIHHADGVNAR